MPDVAKLPGGFEDVVGLIQDENLRAFIRRLNHNVLVFHTFFRAVLSCLDRLFTGTRPKVRLEKASLLSEMN